ncbi:MAG: hypothetical protein V7707_08685 [Motiliproteus sp.]
MDRHDAMSIKAPLGRLSRCFSALCKWWLRGDYIGRLMFTISLLNIGMGLPR